MIKINAYWKKLILKKNEIVPIIRHCAAEDVSFDTFAMNVMLLGALQYH